MLLSQAVKSLKCKPSLIRVHSVWSDFSDVLRAGLTLYLLKSMRILLLTTELGQLSTFEHYALHSFLVFFNCAYIIFALLKQFMANSFIKALTTKQV